MSLLARREFLARAWRWGLGLIGAAGAWTSWDFLRPAGSDSLGGQVRGVPPELVPSEGVLEIPTARAYLTKVGEEVVALWWKCPHLGCKVPFCESSGQFECPCHGSIFNRIGEYRAGPAPRGMDRFAFTIADGQVVIDTTAVTRGGPPGGESIDEPARGPSCLEEGTT
jgi:cytochrome b6-f complex iron-sulfur subunit